MTKKNNIRLIAGAVIGAGLGYAYYYFIGCNGGTCPITSNPYISTAYGAVLGGIFAWPTKKVKAAGPKDE